VEGPVGIVEELAAEEHEIGIALLDKCVGLGGLGDEAYGGGGNVGLAADSGGKLDLVTGAYGNLGIGDQAAGGNIHQIDAMVAEEAGDLNSFVDVPAAFPPQRRRPVAGDPGFGPIGGGDADEEGEMGRPHGADGIHDLEDQAGAVLKAAAVAISALVGERGEELVEKIAVGGVDLNKVKARRESPERRLTKGLDHCANAGLVKRLGDGVAGGKGEGAGRNGLPAAIGGQEQAL
jgi:hypothetical protein